MKEYRFDSVIIGGGAAGMAAAIEITKRGFSAVIVEREEHLGGILLQCIHNGFGLHQFKEELTGPEYAERVSDEVRQLGIPAFLETTVTAVKDGDVKEIHCCSKAGVFIIRSHTVVLAMGCRERNRGNIGIPGARPAGIFTAGLAQRLINIDGLVPGKRYVIVGSGDIGLIMARRLSWIGCQVQAVVEIQPYPAGLVRNIVQCLHDFKIPLHLSHAVTNIHGRDRIEAVDVTPIIEGVHDFSKTFRLDCDCLLLSVGLIPENELSRKAGVRITPQHNGPEVDACMMTNRSGIFACGNVLHVHDLVDFVSEEGGRTGRFVARHLDGCAPRRQFAVEAGQNIRYVVPAKADPATENRFYMRPMIVKNEATLEIKINNTTVRTLRKTHIQPSEMICVTLAPEDLARWGGASEPTLQFSLA